MSRDLALTVAWLGVAGLLLALVSRIASGDLAAAAGVVLLFIWGLGSIVWYETDIAQRPFSDAPPDRLRRAALERFKHLRLPIMLCSRWLPGFWIGFVATRPVLVAVCYLLVFEALFQMNERVPPRLPEDPLRLQKRPHWRGLLRTIGAVFISVGIGIGTRVALASLKSWA